MINKCEVPCGYHKIRFIAGFKKYLTVNQLRRLNDAISNWIIDCECEIIFCVGVDYIIAEQQLEAQFYPLFIGIFPGNALTHVLNGTIQSILF